MSLENTLPSRQPGQRALRLVSPPLEENLQTTSPVTPSTASPALRRLQRDLEAAKAEARSLHELLEELPAILEHKFHLRLRGVLAEQRQLEHHNALLQHHLLSLQGGGRAVLAPAQPPALPAGGQSGAPNVVEASDSPITQGLGLRRALRHLHR